MAEHQEMDESEEPPELSDEEINAALHELGLTRGAPRVRAKTDWTVDTFITATTS